MTRIIATLAFAAVLAYIGTMAHSAASNIMHAAHSRIAAQ